MSHLFNGCQGWVYDDPLMILLFVEHGRWLSDLRVDCMHWADAAVYNEGPVNCSSASSLLFLTHQLQQLGRASDVTCYLCVEWDVKFQLCQSFNEWMNHWMNHWMNEWVSEWVVVVVVVIVEMSPQRRFMDRSKTDHRYEVSQSQLSLSWCEYSWQKYMCVWNIASGWWDAWVIMLFYMTSTRLTVQYACHVT